MVNFFLFLLFLSCFTIIFVIAQGIIWIAKMITDRYNEPNVYTWRRK